ncbi:uncharacterized protein [Spinacia oleracea]|uniref:CCHC-type domain-containing protein n=1 Tax=Spinacia oleracea TaxID=3562 RepID=A0ABM3RS28_SPIOL|nr:uncharacterized protein LOC130472039 [Spinacia oleracea]
MVDIAANVERVVLLREAKNVGYKRRNENQSQGGAKKPNQGYQGNQRRNDVGNKGQGYRGNQNNRAQECAKCGRRGHIESECRVGSNTYFQCGSHDHYIRDFPKQDMVDIAANVERVVLLREAKNVGYKRRNENQSQGGAKKPNQGYQGNQRRNDVGNKGQGYRGNQNNRAQECAKCGRRGHIESECRVGSNTCFRCGSHDHYIRDCPKQRKLSFEQT